MATHSRLTYTEKRQLRPSTFIQHEDHDDDCNEDLAIHANGPKANSWNPHNGEEVMMRINQYDSEDGQNNFGEMWIRRPQYQLNTTRTVEDQNTKEDTIKHSGLRGKTTARIIGLAEEKTTN